MWGFTSNSRRQSDPREQTVRKGFQTFEMTTARHKTSETNLGVLFLSLGSGR